MKRLKFILVAISLFTVGYSNAQISANDTCGTNCRIITVDNSNGSVSKYASTIAPPLWGPVGYTRARYYYLPDVEAYYDIYTSRFIYLHGDNWIFDKELPAQYANYDIDHGYKVVLTGYLGTTPYTHFNEDKKQYVIGYRGKPQTTFRDNIVPRTDNAPPIKQVKENNEAEK